ncbi:Retrovirus-related Pol polyprotein from transposon TNT 1-94 [Quillaja saponaria]|uniref:Retrovirus-related Pol polyprotein from transposon TNT 1-94 n=1 Tax=Quillaja saponaria TaxID=32244 RepID=A0AAD7L072_QUISA|nr:Retrovirus-related Pol polyprotein from transposon TNT 1-94 [Quillaja saponaria]
MTDGNNSGTEHSSRRVSVESDSPYFMHSSDNPSALFMSFLLNGDNYPSWKRAWRMLYLKTCMTMLHMLR